MATAYYPSIVTSGLALCVDAANPKSYSPNVHPQPLDMFAWFAGTVGSCTIERDFSTSKSPAGGIPLKMSVTGNDPYMATYNASQYHLAPAATGQTWTVSVWIKGSTNTTAELFIFGDSAVGGNVFSIVNYGAGTVNVTTEWTRVSYSFTFSNASVARVQVRLDGPNSGGSGQTLWWDGLQVEKASSASKFNPRSNPNETNLYDVGRNQNVGTLINGPAYAGDASKYLTFDGTDDYISVPNSASLQVADTFTISAWIYPTSLANRFSVFSARTANTTGCWQLEVGTGNGGQGRISVTGIGTWIWDSADNVISANNWYNICFVKPNNATQGGSMYLNGNLITPGQTTAYTILNNNDAKLIGAGTGISQYFTGRISSVSLYNTALTQADVKQNFNALRGRYNL